MKKNLDGTAKKLTAEKGDIREAISRYDQGISMLRKKLHKMQHLRKCAKQSIKHHQIRREATAGEIEQARDKVLELTQRINDLENTHRSKSKSFQENMFLLEELRGSIRDNTTEVHAKTQRLMDACSEWEFANNLTVDICSTSRRAAYASYRRWLLTQPVIQIWMALDARVNSTIYAQAQLEGFYEEFAAHIEAKNKIQEFGESRYDLYRDDDEIGPDTMKLLQVERQERAAAFDEMHLNAAKKLRRLVSSCERLKEDIALREHLRLTMNSYMMELSNGLDVDILQSLERCEVEAVKPLSKTIEGLRTQLEMYKLQRQPTQKFSYPTQRELVAAAACDEAAINNATAAVSTDDGKSQDQQEQQQQQQQLLPPRLIASPPQRVKFATAANNNTATNTAAAAGKLRHHAHRQYNLPSPEVPQSDDSPVNHTNIATTTTGITSGEARGEGGGGGIGGGGNLDSMLAAAATDSESGQLFRCDRPEHRAAADWYVQTFNRSRNSRVNRWCKTATTGIHEGVVRLFPRARFPVELIPEKRDPGDAKAVEREHSKSKSGNSMNNIRKSMRKSNYVRDNSGGGAGSGGRGGSNSTDPNNNNSKNNSKNNGNNDQPANAFGFGQIPYLREADGYFSASAIEHRRKLREQEERRKEAQSSNAAAAQRLRITMRLQLSERETHYDMHSPLLDSLGLIQRRKFSDEEEDDDEDGGDEDDAAKNNTNKETKDAKNAKNATAGRTTVAATAAATAAEPSIASTGSSITTDATSSHVKEQQQQQQQAPAQQRSRKAPRRVKVCEPHRYRQHKSMHNNNKISGVGGGGRVKNSDDKERTDEAVTVGAMFADPTAYSVYVDQKDMMVHSGLTSRQAVRNVQNATSYISFESISKISDILSSATQAAADLSIKQASMIADDAGEAGSSASNFKGQQSSLQQLQQGPGASNSGAAVVAAAATSDGAISALELLEIEQQAATLNDTVERIFLDSRVMMEEWAMHNVHHNYKHMKCALDDLLALYSMQPTEAEERAAMVAAVVARKEKLRRKQKKRRGTGAALSDGYSSASGTDEADSATSDPDQYDPLRYSSSEDDEWDRGDILAMTAGGATARDDLSFSMKNVLELSRNVAETIQKQMDDLNRRQNQNLVGLTDMQDEAELREAHAASKYYASYDDASSDENDGVFDPAQYAFDRARVASPPHSRGISFASHALASMDNTQHQHQLQHQAHGRKGDGQGGNSHPQHNLPLVTTVLNSMESIIRNDLYIIDLVWIPHLGHAELIAKHYLKRSQYKMFKFNITPRLISKLTGTPPQLAMQLLSKDSFHVTQAVIGNLHEERIQDKHYAVIASRVHNGVYVAPHRPHFSHHSSQHHNHHLSHDQQRQQQIEHEAELERDRQAVKNDLQNFERMLVDPQSEEQDIANSHRNSNNNNNNSSSNINDGNTSTASAAATTIAGDNEHGSSNSSSSSSGEFEYMMHVLVVRSKRGELLAYSFPSIRASEE